MTQQTTKTQIVVLLDRSGSMASIADDVIGGYNAFLGQQKDNGNDATITLVQFDSNDPLEVLYENLPIDQVQNLTDRTFIPRGGTPLLDATGKLIARIREQRATDPRPTNEQPDVLFVTITDGHENASREVDLATVRQLVQTCEQQGWTFVFLSAAFDAYGESRALGFSEGKTRAFRASGKGAGDLFSTLSFNTTNMREKKRRGVYTNTDDFFDEKEVKRILGDDEDDTHGGGNS